MMHDCTDGSLYKGQPRIVLMETRRLENIYTFKAYTDPSRLDYDSSNTVRVLCSSSRLGLSHD
jgi:hypothetical protein